jgi:hypothetical protein
MVGVCGGRKHDCAAPSVFVPRPVHTGTVAFDAMPQTLVVYNTTSLIGFPFAMFLNVQEIGCRLLSFEKAADDPGTEYISMICHRKASIRCSQIPSRAHRRK